MCVCVCSWSQVSPCPVLRSWWAKFSSRTRNHTNPPITQTQRDWRTNLPIRATSQCLLATTQEVRHKDKRTFFQPRNPCEMCSAVTHRRSLYQNTKQTINHFIACQARRASHGWKIFMTKTIQPLITPSKCQSVLCVCVDLSNCFPIQQTYILSNMSHHPISFILTGTVMVP